MKKVTVQRLILWFVWKHNVSVLLRMRIYTFLSFLIILLVTLYKTGRRSSYCGNNGVLHAFLRSLISRRSSFLEIFRHTMKCRPGKEAAEVGWTLGRSYLFEKAGCVALKGVEVVNVH